MQAKKLQDFQAGLVRWLRLGCGVLAQIEPQPVSPQTLNKAGATSNNEFLLWPGLLQHHRDSLIPTDDKIQPAVTVEICEPNIEQAGISSVSRNNIFAGKGSVAVSEGQHQVFLVPLRCHHCEIELAITVPVAKQDIPLLAAECRSTTGCKVAVSVAQ